MDKYDYRSALMDDIGEYIDSEVDFNDFDTKQDLYDYLYAILWSADSVTGNASGSYTFNTYIAEENICHNLDLLADACEEFGYEQFDIINDGAESADVMIRCYLLGSCLSDVLDSFEYEFENNV